MRRAAVILAALLLFALAASASLYAVRLGASVHAYDTATP
jgi:hypothetical protein